jgi:hypothetical protein
MEFVKVLFPTERDVFIDGQVSGKTNQVLAVGLGHHKFTLGGPPNYTPSEIDQLVSGTSSEFPMIIQFGQV